MGGQPGGEPRGLWPGRVAIGHGVEPHEHSVGANQLGGVAVGGELLALEPGVAHGAGVNRPIPCTGVAGTGDAGALTPLIGSDQLVLACTPEPDETSSRSVLYLSTDNGGTWSQLGTAACAIRSLTRTSTAVFGACATGIVRLPLTGGTATTSLAAPGLGYVGFTDDHDGVTTAGTPEQPSALYLTRDGGQHWTKAVT